MKSERTITNSAEGLADALDLINVVPNPYKAYSEYENNKLDNRVKITNLPEKCTVRIYNMQGKMIREFKKDSDITYLDWTLTNQDNIPVSSGVYLIHIDVPGIGEKVIKSFVAMRMVDLQNL
jgi:predicted DNA-binding helix-hairpin-helix protein